MKHYLILMTSFIIVTNNTIESFPIFNLIKTWICIAGTNNSECRTKPVSMSKMSENIGKVSKTECPNLYTSMLYDQMTIPSKKSNAIINTLDLNHPQAHKFQKITEDQYKICFNIQIKDQEQTCPNK